MSLAANNSAASIQARFVDLDRSARSTIVRWLEWGAASVVAPYDIRR